MAADDAIRYGLASRPRLKATVVWRSCWPTMLGKRPVRCFSLRGARKGGELLAGEGQFGGHAARTVGTPAGGTVAVHHLVVIGPYVWTVTLDVGLVEVVLDARQPTEGRQRWTDAARHRCRAPHVLAFHGHLRCEGGGPDVASRGSIDDVIDTTDQVLETIQPLTQARMDLWMDGGLEPLEAAELGFRNRSRRPAHHGELRGVEIKLTNMAVSELDSNTLQVSANWVSPTARPC